MSRSAVRRAAVLGSPISHSKSPQLHSAAYQYLGVDIDYTRIELSEAQAAGFVSASAKDYLGFSVTMPLKSVLVEKMTTVSDRVATLGVLNTISVTVAGEGPPSLHGENTDVDGIIAALKEAGLHASGRGTFAVIGAGATAAAALAAAAGLGFASARLYARSPARAAAAVPLAERLGLQVHIRALSRLPQDLKHPGVDAVVSTLPPRAADSLAAELTTLDQAPALLDVAYAPWPSALARSWEAAGGPVASGLDMLLHQAVKQVEIFTESAPRPAAALSDADHTEMVSRMRAALAR